VLGRCAFCHGPLVTTRTVTQSGMPWFDFVNLQLIVGNLPTPPLFCDDACRLAGQFWLEEKVNA